MSARAAGGAEDPQATALPRRDIVVIGASAGGVEALQKLVARIPAGLPASVFVVLHLPEEGTSTLPTILNRAGMLPAAHAANAEHIRPERIYVAPPGRHLLLSKGRIHLSPGPKENGHRPAIDPLFRSAASAYGPRVVAVLLSGMLDDGTAGFHAVKKAGGATLVQDPDEALYRSMPESAVLGSPVDSVLPVEQLARKLTDLVDGQAVLGDVRGPLAGIVADEPSPVGQGVATSEDPPGVPTGLTCPECQGVLWDVSEAGLVRYRCRVGHAYNGRTLESQQSQAVESALWTATRLLEERAVLLDNLALRMQEREHPRSAKRFADRAGEALRQAGSIRRLLVDDDASELAAALGSENAGGHGDGEPMPAG